MTTNNPALLTRLMLKYKRFITFFGVGLLNTAIDYAVFMLLRLLTPLGLEVCQTAGFLAGLINSFIMNRSVTFRKGASTSLPMQVLRFAVVNGVSLAVSILCIRGLVGGLHIHEAISKLFVSGIVMVINYLGYKIFVFAVRDEAGEGE